MKLAFRVSLILVHDTIHSLVPRTTLPPTIIDLHFDENKQILSELIKK